MEKISIIVPIYNGQAYIKKCIQSLTSQTYSNIEILCIDDGSTDSSLDILTNLAQQDQRIIIIHQNNSGVKSGFGDLYSLLIPFLKQKKAAKTATFIRVEKY